MENRVKKVSINSGKDNYKKTRSQQTPIKITSTLPKIGYSLKRHRKILGKQAKAAGNCFYSERKCLIVT